MRGGSVEYSVSKTRSWQYIPFPQQSGSWFLFSREFTCRLITSMPCGVSSCIALLYLSSCIIVLRYCTKMVGSGPDDEVTVPVMFTYHVVPDGSPVSFDYSSRRWRTLSWTCFNPERRGDRSRESVSVMFPGILQGICRYHFVKEMGKSAFSRYTGLRGLKVSKKALAAISGRKYDSEGEKVVVGFPQWCNVSGLDVMKFQLPSNVRRDHVCCHVRQLDWEKKARKIR